MAVSSLSFVLQSLNSLLQKEVGLLLGVDKEMKRLESTLSTIEAVLEDADQKQLQDKAIKNWLRKIKGAACEVEDILDECETEALLWKYKGQSSGSLKKVSTSLLTCYPVKNIIFRHKIGNRMKEITENLDAISEERLKFHFREVVVEKRVENAESRETSSVLTQPQLYGRHEDKEKIVKVLVEDVQDREDGSVYPIIGMGGLGKTTLAQMAYNDERVKCHFEPKIWVYVSEDFDMKKVIKTTIESACGKVVEASNLDYLQKNLRDMLNGKRYLIVLDDVWSEDQEEWNKLKYVLACGSKGASIITTTRLENVASIMGTLPPHHLSFLSEEDCWLLFKQGAFGNVNEEHPKLVAIGKEIVKKCGGVPLAAKALGGLMQSIREEREWHFIKDSEIWSLPQQQGKNCVLPALILSYYNLPLELRRCFAYCGVFWKGYEMEKDTLIQLWMAHGLISYRGKQELEDIGDQVCRELYWRSLFQDPVKDEYGCVTRFKMHDLVHDLAQSVMEDEYRIMKVSSPSDISNKRVRHVELVGRATSGYSRKLDFVRVFRAYAWTNLPDSSIGNLKRLRYLDFSCSKMRQLPNSICRLWNLQTLKLNYCTSLKRLPQNMKNLRNLRHLYLKDCRSIDEMPPNFGQLTCLKTLSSFVVGKSRGCDVAQLQCLNLGGDLRIEHLERVRNPMDAKEADLVGKQNLRQLELSWYQDNNGVECESSQENVEQLVLEALQPHPNLKKLLIQGYGGSHFPLWMMTRDSTTPLQNMLEIELTNCKKCLQLPPFGQLPLLRRLVISEMDKVEYIIDNDYFPGGGGFPSLQELTIDSLPNLKGLSREEEGRELLPRLRRLYVFNCPKFMSFPTLPSPKQLTVCGCTDMLLNSISNLSSLTKLSVSDNEETISFPEEVLGNQTVLEYLCISGFENLKTLPKDLASLVSLKSLAIRWCPNLESLLDKGLRGGLQSLRSLTICYCNKLMSSLTSEGCGQLTALETLWISECPELTSLPDWLGNLTSLQSLTVSRCPKIASLPESIQSLTKLQELYIGRCGPELARRCEKGNGDDWYKIAHIPKVTVTDMEITAECIHTALNLCLSLI